MTRVLIGIDDTDNLESRGTGWRARQLGKAIEAAGLGRLEGISRHQLLVDPRIPYTSHNSSACLEITGCSQKGAIALARAFLLKESADGSDAGLCTCLFDEADEGVVNWGLRAKREVLTKAEALDLAGRKGIYLEGLTGTRDGIIGSLAAVGLRKWGSDGRIIGTGRRDIRELKGKFTVKQVMEEVKLDAVTDREGNPMPEGTLIDLGDWARPVMRGGLITLIAEPLNDNNHEWRVATKEYIKGITG
jgi:hypothetical protein